MTSLARGLQLVTCRVVGQRERRGCVGVRCCRRCFMWVLTATCDALSFLQRVGVSGLVGGVYRDEESHSPLARGHDEGSEEEDEEEDEEGGDLPAAKKPANCTCPKCGKVFVRPGHIPTHMDNATCKQLQKARDKVRGPPRPPRLSLSHPPLQSATGQVAAASGAAAPSANLRRGASAAAPTLEGVQVRLSLRRLSALSTHLTPLLAARPHPRRGVRSHLGGWRLCGVVHAQGTLRRAPCAPEASPHPLRLPVADPVPAVRARQVPGDHHAQAQLGEGAADERQGVLVAIHIHLLSPGRRPRCTCTGCAALPAGWVPGGRGCGTRGAAPAARQPCAASACHSTQCGRASARAESASRASPPPCACVCQSATAALREPGGSGAHLLLTISLLSSKLFGLRMGGQNPAPPRQGSHPEPPAGAWRVLDAFPAAGGAVA
jgi:hypothetical protein